MMRKPLPIEGCTTCPYFRNTFVPPEAHGSPPYDLVLIGEAPGREEEIQGRPFVGRSGQIIRQILQNLSSVRSYYITNVVKCRPPNNETPVKQAFQNGKEFLLNHELPPLSPRVIILLGGVATKALLNKQSVGQVLNTIHEVRIGDRDVPVIPTYHPAAILRRPHLLQHLVQSFSLAENVLEGAVKTADVPEDRVVVLRSDADITDATLNLLESGGFLGGEKLIAFDVETNSLDPFHPNTVLWMMSVSNGEVAVVLFLHPIFGPVQYVRELAKLILSSPSPKVAHNALFDITSLRALLGVEVRNLESDTKILHYLVDENLPHSLDSVMSQLGIRSHKKGFSHKVFQNEDTVKQNFGVIVKYSASDSFVLPMVHRRLWDLIGEKQKHLFEFLLRPAIYALSHLQENGLLVDMDRYKRVGEELKKQIQDKRRELLRFGEVQMYLAEHPSSDVNFNSVAVLREIFFKYGGLPILGQTGKGQPSLRADILEEYCLKYNSKLACVLLEYRKARQLYSTFIKGLLPHINPITNRVHPHYNLTGTVTGRLSASEPNIQQIPKDSVIRPIFHAPPGYLFIEADYSQMELRVAAALSQDPNMIETYKKGIDLHMRTARAVFRKDNISEDERKIAKTINFGILYGMGPQGLMGRLYSLGWNVTEDQAKKFIDSFFSEYPKLREWIKRIEEQVRKTGKVETPLGRVRHLFGSTPRDIRQAVNFPVQSTASDITLISVIRLDREFRNRRMKSKVVGTVHDSILFEVHEDELEIAIPLIKEIMENPPKPEYAFIEPVPIKVDISVGKAWGEKVFEF